MAKVEKVYALINDEEYMGYTTYGSLEEAKEDATEGDVIFEVTAMFDVESTFVYNKRNLSEQV